MTNYKEFAVNNVKNASGMNIMTLSEDQWSALKQFHKQPASYGRATQFYTNEAALKDSNKRITLNGAPLRVNTDINTQVIGKVPSGAEKGNLVILSASVLAKAGVTGAMGTPSIRSDL